MTVNRMAFPLPSPRCPWRRLIEMFCGVLAKYTEVFSGLRQRRSRCAGIAQQDLAAFSKVTLALPAWSVEMLPQCVFPECYGPAVQASAHSRPGESGGPPDPQ